MLRSKELVDGVAAAVVFGAEQHTDGAGLRVGFIACNAHCPPVITLDGTQYVVPSELLSKIDAQAARNITMLEAPVEQNQEKDQ